MFLIPPETPKSFRRGIHNLYKSCCDENKKIIPEKLPEKIMAGEAGWLIMSAKSKNVYLDAAQQEEAEGIYSDIGKKYYEGLDGIERSDLFVADFNGQVHPNFIITKGVLLEIINSEPDYAGVLSSTIEKKRPPLPEENKRQKAEPITFSILKKWVKSLIQSTSYDTFPKFKDLMINTYLQKSPRDEVEKFNEGEQIIDVFCRLNEQKKYTVYFKIKNELGNSTPLKHRALSSLKKIFDTAREEIKNSIENTQ